MCGLRAGEEEDRAFDDQSIPHARRPGKDRYAASPRNRLGNRCTPSTWVGVITPPAHGSPGALGLDLGLDLDLDLDIVGIDIEIE